MPERPDDLTPEVPESDLPRMTVNEYGAAKDSAVVIEEADRTVLLTKDETIVIDKQPRIDIIPANRPRKVYGGMWGNAEIATVGAASLIVLAAILLYFFMVIPSNRELEKNRAESDRLQRELTSARAKYGNITSTESQVAKLISSVSDFETASLPPAVVGKNALYQRINGLISAYGLVNTTGPDYVPLETADKNPGQETEEEKGRAKYKSIFPGVYVTMTLEGSYQNLRRFMTEIERSNEFIVIAAIELQPSDNDSKKTDTAAVANQPTSAFPGGVVPPGFSGITNNPTRMQPQIRPQIQTQPQQQAARGKTHGETVSLRLEMAAYFRRPVFASTDSAPK